MPKVVVIEDDEQFRAYLIAILNDLKIKIFPAENGQEGLELIVSEKPDLIITDIIMPEMEGVEVIMKVREMFESMPIIAISGGNLGNPASYLKMAKKLGANEILEKPFSRIDLISKIQLLLKL